MPAWTRWTRRWVSCGRQAGQLPRIQTPGRTPTSAAGTPSATAKSREAWCSPQIAVRSPVTTGASMACAGASGCPAPALIAGPTYRVAERSHDLVDPCYIGEPAFVDDLLA